MATASRGMRLRRHPRPGHRVERPSLDIADPTMF